MKTKPVCIVLFGAIFFAWGWAGGVCEVASKGPQRFEALIALFTAFAFAGVVISLIIQHVQFKDIMSLQLKAAEAAERAAIANCESAKLALENLQLQRMAACEQKKQITRKIQFQYHVAMTTWIQNSIKIALERPELLPATKDSITSSAKQLEEHIVALGALIGEVSGHEQSSNTSSRPESPTNS